MRFQLTSRHMVRMSAIAAIARGSEGKCATWRWNDTAHNKTMHSWRSQRSARRRLRNSSAECTDASCSLQEPATFESFLELQPFLKIKASGPPESEIEWSVLGDPKWQPGRASQGSRLKARGSETNIKMPIFEGRSGGIIAVDPPYVSS